MKRTELTTEADNFRAKARPGCSGTKEQLITAHGQLLFGTRKPRRNLKNVAHWKEADPAAGGREVQVEGNTVLVEGPKGKVTALIADGITLKTADGQSWRSSARAKTRPRCTG
jgi:hypothetical protein